ncbi:DUF1385 domain-containing protein [Guggenheimella bovis]
MANKTVGGQALIEGVMMRSGSSVAMTFRKPDGTLLTESRTMEVKTKGIWSLPVFRGLYALYSSFKVGTDALNRSSEVAVGEVEESKFEQAVEKHFGKNGIFILNLIISFALAFILFGFLPTFLTSFLKPLTKSRFVLSLIEGLIKVLIFLLYVFSISLIPDIKRVFEYHGAEHKAVFTYEKGLPLTVENARTMSRFHPRCGTSYIFFVLALSILFFSLFRFETVLERVLTKLLFFPLLAGVSFEVLKYSAKDTPVNRALRSMGLLFQHFTTKEPDDDELEVALTAMKRAIDDDTKRTQTIESTD